MVHLIAPDELDPDDALEARWLREYDGAPALEPLHPEEEARGIVLDSGRWQRPRHAERFFANALDDIENGENDATPY